MFYHLVDRIDCFKSGLAKAGYEFYTNAAIATEKPEEIDIISYKKVTTTLADDLKSLVKAANGGVKINPSIKI